jgi:hypothetical protein
MRIVMKDESEETGKSGAVGGVRAEQTRGAFTPRGLLRGRFCG